MFVSGKGLKLYNSHCNYLLCFLSLTMLHLFLALGLGVRFVDDVDGAVIAICTVARAYGTGRSPVALLLLCKQKQVVFSI